MIRNAGNKTLLKLIRRCLLEGAPIEIDGLGNFDLDAERKVVFRPNGNIRVFLAYADEDRTLVRASAFKISRSSVPWSRSFGDFGIPC